MRKWLLLLLLLTSYTFLPAQDSTLPIVEIKQVPSQGILLNKGWKFISGDNPAYADPNYDDSKWQPIDPAKDIHDIPALWKNNIVWFRLHFTLDSTITRSLAMMVQQSGASEIFLNGKLIHQFGVLSTNPEKIRAFNPLDKPVLLPMGKSIEQVLAVRYALQPRIKYSTNFWGPSLAFRMSVNSIENANDQYQQNLIDNNKSTFFKVGAFLLLGILYLAFYLFYPSRKVNLHFSLYAFILGVTWDMLLYRNNLHRVEQWYLISNILLIIQVIAFCFLLNAIYNLFEQKKGWIYYSVFVLGIISIPLGAFVYGWGWLVFGTLFSNLVSIVITYIAFKAVRNQKKGAWIIAVGGICYIIFWVIFSLQWLNFLNFGKIDFFTLAFLSIPIAVSIYLGYDFALTYRLLQQRLIEVESLSHEKQQILASQKEALEKQVAERTAELKQSLEELKAAQAQLIQQEKMASLGELTAGIAHEIQNPLNFVNNFSEVNSELIQELKQENSAGNPKEVTTIAEEIEQNLAKVTHHGKRADAIVKGMLQHSRASTGKKELTDINSIIEEYLRLSYQAIRSKDKSFTTTIDTHFDPTIGKINVVAQDISRVLLNLFNNAFYAVNLKKQQLSRTYEPKVVVATKEHNGNIEIIVQDNGTGIPQNIVNKIFQPFFTTKPTGEGTGLGLSLSYDSIKAHGGELTVNTTEGEGAEFVIQLPIS